MKAPTRRCTRRFAFTLVELLVVVAIIALLLGILLPTINRAREVTRRTLCASNLNLIGKALQTYSVSNSQQYPRASEPDYAQVIFGFQHGLDRDSTTPNPTLLINSATASLWMLISFEGATPDLFICPSTKDTPDALTDDGTPEGNPTSDRFIFDFAQRQNLSYSTMHMFHEVREDNWSPNTNPAWIIMGDNNNASSSTSFASLHVNEAFNNPGSDTIQQFENSTNHAQLGQVFLWADGHTEFHTDPFQGPAEDNAYARDAAAFGAVEEADHPRNRSADSGVSRVRKPDTDTMLIPVSGGRPNQNLDPSDGGPTPTP